LLKGFSFLVLISFIYSLFAFERTLLSLYRFAFPRYVVLSLIYILWWTARYWSQICIECSSWLFASTKWPWKLAILTAVREHNRPYCFTKLDRVHSPGVAGQQWPLQHRAGCPVTNERLLQFLASRCFAAATCANSDAHVSPAGPRQPPRRQHLARADDGNPDNAQFAAGSDALSWAPWVSGGEGVSTHPSVRAVVARRGR